MLQGLELMKKSGSNFCGILLLKVCSFKISSLWKSSILSSSSSSAFAASVIHVHRGISAKFCNKKNYRQWKMHWPASLYCKPNVKGRVGIVEKGIGNLPKGCQSNTFSGYCQSGNKTNIYSMKHNFNYGYSAYHVNQKTFEGPA